MGKVSTEFELQIARKFEYSFLNQNAIESNPSILIPSHSIHMDQFQTTIRRHRVLTEHSVRIEMERSIIINKKLIKITVENVDFYITKITNKKARLSTKSVESATEEIISHENAERVSNSNLT